MTAAGRAAGEEKEAALPPLIPAALRAAPSRQNRCSSKQKRSENYTKPL